MSTSVDTALLISMNMKRNTYSLVFAVRFAWTRAQKKLQIAEYSKEREYHTRVGYV